MVHQNGTTLNGYVAPSKPTRNADRRHAASIARQRAKSADVSPAHNAKCIHRIIQKRMAEGQPIEDLGQYALDDATWSELVAILSPEELEAVNRASGLYGADDTDTEVADAEAADAEFSDDEPIPFVVAPAPTTKPEPLSRSCFRSAVADVASRAKATLPPTVNGRVEKAVQIVLSGDVEAMPDGSIMVGSQSDAAKRYTVNAVALKSPCAGCR